MSTNLHRPALSGDSSQYYRRESQPASDHLAQGSVSLFPSPGLAELRGKSGSFAAGILCDQAEQTMEHINNYEHPGGSTRSLPPGQQIEDRSKCPAWTLPDLMLEFSSEELAELLPELIEAFQADTTQRLEGARSAIAEIDLTRLGNEIHAIKGAAKQMGADALVAVCMEIESSPHEKTKESLEALLSQLETHHHDISRAMTSYIESTGLSTPVKE